MVRFKEGDIGTMVIVIDVIAMAGIYLKLQRMNGLSTAGYIGQAAGDRDRLEAPIRK